MKLEGMDKVILKKYELIVLLSIVLFSCSGDDEIIVDKIEEQTLYTLPVVVHVIHTGEEIGVGYNLSKDRIEGQIETLNNDFRKRKGTLGYNTHPLGTDAQIEFKLAEIDPDGKLTNGINRVNATGIKSEGSEDGWLFDTLPDYGYWNVKDYINVWVLPFEPNMILGQSSVPQADITGLEHRGPETTIGVLITTPHFGKSNIDGGSNLGRSLTHEMGHFLGLEHLWGKTENAPCDEYDDYCADTPYVSRRTGSCDGAQVISCNGEAVLTQNYMDYTDDACMNMFTKDQVLRMRYVLNNSVRKSLIVSSAIDRD